MKKEYQQPMCRTTYWNTNETIMTEDVGDEIPGGTTMSEMIEEW